MTVEEAPGRHAERPTVHSSYCTFVQRVVTPEGRPSSEGVVSRVATSLLPLDALGPWHQIAAVASRGSLTALDGIGPTVVGFQRTRTRRHTT
jgi:hypothetical protein